LLLNSYTRWGHNELMELAVDELTAWLDEIPAVYRKK